MEIRFETVCVHTQEIMTQAYKNMQGRTAYLAWSAFFVLCGVMAAERGIAIAIVSWAIALYFAWAYFGYRYSARVAYKRFAELSGKEAETTVEFYEDHFRQRNAGNEKEITYGKVSGVIETQRLILLKLPQKMYIIVDKEGFRVGNLEEFRDFIKEKAAVKYKRG